MIIPDRQTDRKLNGVCVAQCTYLFLSKCHKYRWEAYVCTAIYHINIYIYIYMHT